MRRDVLLALGFAAVVTVGAWRAGIGQEPPRALNVLGYALAAGAAFGLAWRRRAPLVSLVTAVGLSSVYLLAGYPFGPILLAVVWAMFEYARRRPLRESALAAGVAAGVAIAAVLPRMSQHLSLPAVGLLLWGACWLAVPWSLGAIVSMQRQARAQQEIEIVRRAVLEERIRVSREVHDVAGHGFAVVAMQAGVAMVVLDERPEQAREALRAIRDTSRAALDELRAVIENIDSPADIGGLVEQVRAAGIEVALEHDELWGVSEQQRRIAYEVVRESLTNVLRHAGGTSAAVTVRTEGHCVVVVVVNNGESRPDTDNRPTAESQPDTECQPGADGRSGVDSPTGADSRPRADSPTSADSRTGADSRYGADKRYDADRGSHMDNRYAADGRYDEDSRSGSEAGRGIGGMRERVEAAGGKFEVRTGRRFEIHARIPR